MSSINLYHISPILTNHLSFSQKSKHLHHSHLDPLHLHQAVIPLAPPSWALVGSCKACCLTRSYHVNRAYGSISQVLGSGQLWLKMRYLSKPLLVRRFKDMTWTSMKCEVACKPTGKPINRKWDNNFYGIAGEMLGASRRMAPATKSTIWAHLDQKWVPTFKFWAWLWNLMSKNSQTRSSMIQ